jgi:hypothetical protein
MWAVVSTSIENGRVYAIGSDDDRGVAIDRFVAGMYFPNNTFRATLAKSLFEKNEVVDGNTRITVLKMD